MTIAHAAHRQRIEAGVAFEWDRIPQRRTSMKEVPADVTTLAFQRQRRSHRGIGELRALTTLWAWSVDQSFLDEIGAITSLRTLYMSNVRAEDLTPLQSLPRLERLVIEDATRVADLEWARSLVSVRSFGLENLRRVGSLEPLSALHRLTALGVEGGMWTPMRVDSLAPLSALASVESLFLTNLRVADRSLAPLHGLSRLRVLQCADYFPAGEMRALARALPGLDCDWFEKYAKA